MFSFFKHYEGVTVQVYFPFQPEGLINDNNTVKEHILRIDIYGFHITHKLTTRQLSYLDINSLLRDIRIKCHCTTVMVLIVLMLFHLAPSTI